MNPIMITEEWRLWRQASWEVDWYECPECAAMVQHPAGVDKHKAWHDGQRRP